MTYHKIVYCLLAGVLMLNLGGCSTVSSSSRVGAARKQFKSSTTYAQGIGLGIVAGAAVGALVGELSGRGWQQGALVGGLVGGFAGGAFAHHKVKQRKAYYQREGVLDKAIQQTANTRREADKFNRVLASELRKTKRDRAEIESDLSNARYVSDRLDGEIDRQNSNLSRARSLGASSGERSRLRSQISELEMEKAQLEGYIDKLDRSRKTKPVVGR